MKYLAIVLFAFLTASCDYVHKHKVPEFFITADFAEIIKPENQGNLLPCYRTKHGINVFQTSEGQCPPQWMVEADTKFVADYADVIPEAFAGVNLIYHKWYFSCAGLIARGCTDGFLDVVVTNREKVRGTTRHELWHIACQMNGQPELGHRSWLLEDIEAGPPYQWKGRGGKRNNAVKKGK